MSTPIHENNPPEPLTPIFKTEGGWCFYDETWANSHGPYPSRQEAERELQKYAEWLIRGEEPSFQ